MSKIADGWLLTLHTGQMIFCPESLLITDKEGNYVLDGGEVYIVMFRPQPNNRVECAILRPKASPERIAKIIIPKHGIVKKERVYENSLIYTTVVKERSNIILPGNANIPDSANVHTKPHQG